MGALHWRTEWFQVAVTMSAADSLGPEAYHMSRHSTGLFRTRWHVKVVT